MNTILSNVLVSLTHLIPRKKSKVTPMAQTKGEPRGRSSQIYEKDQFYLRQEDEGVCIRPTAPNKSRRPSPRITLRGTSQTLTRKANRAYFTSLLHSYRSPALQETLCYRS
ncbi:hypothetical protein K402DRAFT_389108 [Aulographum hederae CBS 113979]|uniref:Uncharacterized protein n=1 Tax=Aulographum hederae CBS 113979 TaxID=1176131 RepID=A0A6G1HEQ9_9PEZI|nr:hypothetical protein K402DRAFT_389108 [Aulographum hederae CBS 113979]